MGLIDRTQAIREMMDEDVDHAQGKSGREVIQILMDMEPAQPEHECETCRYNSKEWNEEPCDSCTMGGSTNHWKPMYMESEHPQRLRGRWIDRNGNIVSPFWERYECSECGARSDNTNYCPNCGADMRGGEQDGDGLL